MSSVGSIGFHPRYLVGVALQPGAQVRGQVVGVDTAAVTVAQNRRRLVVITDDDEAAVGADVKHIESTDLTCRVDDTSVRCSSLALMSDDELPCQFQGLFLG